MPDGGPVVIDRYNMVYAYGPLNRICQTLKESGIAEVAPWAAPAVPYPHALHYHLELNGIETELLSAFSWVRKPLRDTDVQFWSGPRASQRSGAAALRSSNLEIARAALARYLIRSQLSSSVR